MVQVLVWGVAALAWSAAAATLAAVSASTPFLAHDYYTRWLTMPGILLTAPVPVLVAASVQIAGRRSWNIKVEGHTDSVGGRKFNKILSEKRAQAVADWLIKNMSVRAGQVLPIGRGMDRPIAPNQTKNGRDNPVGRRLNRRVEITLYP